MKNIIKFLFPEQVKKKMRRLEDLFLRLRFGFNKPVILNGQYGIKFLLYPKQSGPIRWMIEGGAYSKEYSAIDKLVELGDTAFDIGSHVGMLGMYLAKKVGSTGKVYSFEPFPDSFEKLKENIAVNHFSHVICEQKALSDISGSSQFYFEPTNHQLNSLGKVSNGTTALTTSIVVQTDTVDSYCQKNTIKTIDFLKIDTEGYEINVLKGASKMLDAKTIEIIQFEISSLPLESLGRKPDEILEYLATKKYKVFEYNEIEKTFKEITSIVAGYDNFYASFKDLQHI